MAFEERCSHLCTSHGLGTDGRENNSGFGQQTSAFSFLFFFAFSKWNSPRVSISSRPITYHRGHFGCNYTKHWTPTTQVSSTSTPAFDSPGQGQVPAVVCQQQPC